LIACQQGLRRVVSPQDAGEVVFGYADYESTPTVWTDSIPTQEAVAFRFVDTSKFARTHRPKISILRLFS